MAESSGEVTAAAMDQPGGFGVAVKRLAVVKVEVLGDLGVAVPAEEAMLNFVALRMIADGALAGVAR